MGWVMASAPDEDSAVDSYWDGNEWQANLNEALFFGEAAGITVEAARREQGSFQQRYDDRDVRMLRAQQTITLVPAAP